MPKISAKIHAKTPADPAAPDPASRKRSPSKAAKAVVRKARAKPSDKTASPETAKPKAKRPRAKPAARSKSATGKKPARLPARKTFLVAATLPDGVERPELRVYAAVMRSAVEALAAVRAALGPEVAVELTGKLSNRMAKTLGLKADEVRQI